MATNATQNIQVTIEDTGVAIIQFNRPNKRNAFNQAMITEIVTTLQSLDSDDSVRAVILTGGAEGSFCGRFWFVTDALFQ